MKGLALMVSEKRQTFFSFSFFFSQMKKYISYLCWICAIIKKVLYSGIEWSYEVSSWLNWIRTSNFQLKLFDTAVTLKCGQGRCKWYAGKAQGVVRLTACRVWHWSYYSVWKKSQCYSFCQASQPVSWPNTDHYLDPHFSCE